MKKKKLFSLVLATVLTAATVLPCYGASTKEKISNAQAEQAAAQSQLDSIQSRIDELNSKKGQSEEYLSELNQQLDDLQNRLQELQDQYDAKQNELVQIQADLEDAKAKEEEQYEAMKLRIQYMYENSSGNGYMAMLFSSKSISELISRAEYIQKISDFDRDLMQEYEDTVDQVKEKETQVQEEQAAIVELQQQSSDQQEAIQELYAAAYQELRTYSAELDDAKSSESALVDEINSKADAINDLIRQAKEEEIAAQKKAEEEASNLREVSIPCNWRSSTSETSLGLIVFSGIITRFGLNNSSVSGDKLLFHPLQLIGNTGIKPETGQFNDVSSDNVRINPCIQFHIFMRPGTNQFHQMLHQSFRRNSSSKLSDQDMLLFPVKIDV